MDWLAQLGETGASTLPLLCVRAGRSPRLLATSLRDDQLLILRPSKGVGCAGPNRVLGSSWFERRQGWGYLQAPSCCGDQARSHCQRLRLFWTAVFVEVAVENHWKCGSHDGSELSLITFKNLHPFLCDLIFRPCTQQWLHCTWVLQVPWLPLSFFGTEVRRCAEWPCCFFQVWNLDHQ